MKETKKQEEEEEKALLKKEDEEKKEKPEKLEKPEEPEPEPEKPEEPEKRSDAVTKVYKHNFVNCHLTLSSPEETGTQSIAIVLQKPIKEPWGFYSTVDENIQKLIEKSPYFGRKSGFRILESSEAEANKGKATKGKLPKYKPGVMSGIK